jgi:methylated-DNA-protein-cysteine methyltransferase-like protein
VSRHGAAPLARLGVRAAERRRVSTWEKYYAVIRRIPRGRVATYGQVARLAGRPRHARQVGYALYALPEGSRVPWQRVINAAGGLSTGRATPGGDLRQRFLLEREGVTFGLNGRIALRLYGWRPGTTKVVRRR